MNIKIKKVLSAVMSCCLLTALLPFSAFAQYRDISKRLKDLTLVINSNLAINNTAYEGILPKGSKYDLKNYIPARQRYAHSSAEMRISGIHGLYPSRYSMGVNNTVYTIRELASLDIQNNYTERALTPVFTSAFVHEAVYIEALLALADLASRNKLKDPVIKPIIIHELTFLNNFTRHELLYATGEEYDAALRAEIGASLKKLGVKKIESAQNNAEWAVFNRKKETVFNKVNNALFVFSIASLGAAGVKGGASSFASTPKATPSLRLASAPRTTTNAPSAASNIIQMKPAASNNYGVTASFEGSAALKLNPQASPLQLVKTTPAAQATPAAAPYAAGAAQIPVVPALLTEYKTSPDMNALGQKLEQLRALNKEQLKHKIRKGEKITQKDLNGLPLVEQVEIYNAARRSGLFEGPMVLPADNSLEPDTYFVNSADMPANLPKENIQWLETIEKYEQGILKNYALSESYIEGYYTRRIYPYLSKPTYRRDSEISFYRGMFLTLPEIKHILKNGMELNKTSWHTGAQGNKPIISVSSSINEAASYIFQSKLEKANQGAIGVVIEVERNHNYKIFDDKELNSTNTIFHTYRSVPAEEITAIYIWGPYGLEQLKHVGMKIEKGEADSEWIKAFDQARFLR